MYKRQVEGARTGDASGHLRSVDLRKHHRYRPLRDELQQQFPDYQVAQLNFIMGIRGTIDEHQWRRNLTLLKVAKKDQDLIIRRCITASIETMQALLATTWR